MNRDKLQTSRRRPPVLYNTLLLVAAFAVVFVACEGILRLFYHPENLGTVIRFDPSLGWSLDPGAHMHSSHNPRGLDYHIQINSLGLRDKEISPTKPPGTRRIVVVGDSFVFGTGVESRWRTTDILDRALGERVEVINAGVSGWGTDQELIHYETVLRDLEPDMVIVTMMAANDVINNMLDHLFLSPTTPKPRFSLQGGQLLWSGPVKRPAPNPRAAVRNTLRKSRLLMLVKRSADIVFDRPESDSGVAAESGLEQEWMRQRGYSHWLVYEKEHESTLEEGWQLTEAILQRFARVCESDGVDFMVLAFPLKIEVQDEWRERLMARAGVDESALDLKKPYERLEQICRSNDIDVIYPLQAFREGALHRDLYFQFDGHPNQYGHVMAARVLLEHLTTRYNYHFEIPPADQPHFTALR